MTSTPPSESILNTRACLTQAYIQHGTYNMQRERFLERRYDQCLLVDETYQRQVVLAALQWLSLAHRLCTLHHHRLGKRWRGGSIRTGDSRRQFAPVLESNTNAQIMSLLVQILRSIFVAGVTCWSGQTSAILSLRGHTVDFCIHARAHTGLRAHVTFFHG